MDKCYKCEYFIKCHYFTLPIGEKFNCKYDKSKEVKKMKKLSKERLALLKKLYLKGELSMVFHQYLPAILKSIKDDNVSQAK